MLERLRGVHAHGDDADDGAGSEQGVHPLQTEERNEAGCHNILSCSFVGLRRFSSRILVSADVFLIDLLTHKNVQRHDRAHFYRCNKITRHHTHWFVDPEDVSAVRQGLIWPKVSHGLGLDPWALFPLQHAGARRAIQRVNLTTREREEEHTVNKAKWGRGGSLWLHPSLGSGSSTSKFLSKILIQVSSSSSSSNVWHLTVAAPTHRYTFLL